MVDDLRFRPPTSRRTVLKASLATAGLAATGASLSLPSSVCAGDHLRVGVLLPYLSRYPAIGARVLHGLQAYAAHTTPAHALHSVVQTATYRPLSSAARQAVQTLIERDRVDLIVGVLGASMAAQVRDVVEQHGVPLIALGSGANVIRSAERSYYVIAHTLQSWQASWALGRWTAQQRGRNVVALASCYESGYDALYAFELGVAAGGGTLHQTHITHVPGQAGDLPALLRRVAADRPDAIYALYSGTEAADFLAAYSASPLVGRVPLVAAPWLTTGDLLVMYGPQLIGAAGAVSWAGTPGLVQRALAAALLRPAEQVRDPFTALAYDTARLIDETARRAGEVRAAAWLQAVDHAAFTGVRGSLRVDAASRAVTAPIYLTEVRRTGAGVMPVVLNELEIIDADDRRLAALHSSPKTGWSQPHLIA